MVPKKQRIAQKSSSVKLKAVAKHTILSCMDDYMEVKLGQLENAITTAITVERKVTRFSRYKV